MSAKHRINKVLVTADGRGHHATQMAKDLPVKIRNGKVGLLTLTSLIYFNFIIYHMITVQIAILQNSPILQSIFHIQILLEV
jgi:hypothetical protein